MSPFTTYGYTLLSPEIILTVLGIVLLLVAIFTDHPENRINLAVPFVAVVGLLLALGAVIGVYGFTGTHALSDAALNVDRGGHLRVDALSLFFKGIVIGASILVVLMSRDYSRRFASPGEFYGLLVFTTLAASFLCSAADLVTIYLSMEFLSITSYAMAGYAREDPRSNEAALKYFLYGALNSALMLYGITLLYGLSATGTVGQPASTGLAEVIRGVSSQLPTPLAVIAVVFTLAGFLFKVSAVPFHQWAPDTYQGAPTPFTAFLSVASKAGGLAILVRVVATIFLVPQATAGAGFTLAALVGFLIAVVSVLSMLVGNVLAIQQRDIKRMLAYSGIAQIGYLLIAVVAMQGLNANNALQAMVVYFVTYLFMNLGAFSVVTAINNRIHSSDLNDYAGLSQRSPWLAFAMAVFMLSLAGIPPAAGWFGKYYIFQAAVAQSQNGIFAHGTLNATDILAFMLVLNSVIAAFYYLGVIKRMYFDAPEATSPVPVEGSLKAGIIFAMLVTLALGMLPSPLVQMVNDRISFRVDQPSITAPLTGQVPR